MDHTKSFIHYVGSQFHSYIAHVQSVCTWFRICLTLLREPAQLYINFVDRKWGYVRLNIFEHINYVYICGWLCTAYTTHVSSRIRNVLLYRTYFRSLWFISAIRKAPNNISDENIGDLITKETLFICRYMYVCWYMSCSLYEYY